MVETKIAQIIDTNKLCEIFSKGKIIVFIFPYNEELLTVEEKVKEIREIYEIHIPHAKEVPHEMEELRFSHEFTMAKAVMIEFTDYEEAHEYIMRLDEKRGKRLYSGYACMYMDGEFVEENT